MWHTQTVLIPRTLSRGAAIRWALGHGYKATKVHATALYWRLRQAPPGSFRRYRIVHLPGGFALEQGAA